jgi:fucose permease
MAFKTSVLIFYLRLAKNTQIVLRYASWATLIVVNLAGTVLTFMNIFQCQPIHAAWDTNVRESSECIPLLTEFICAAPVNIVTDLAILALPIPVLTGMRLPSRQKTILVFTFTLGIFVTIVDVVRIYYLQQAIGETPTGSSTSPGSRFGGEADFAWNASLSLMWSAVEVNVGIICACIPTLKPLILRLLPAMLYDPDGSRTMSSTKGRSDRESDSQPGHENSPSVPQAATLPPSTDMSSGAAQDNSAQDNQQITALDFLTTPDMDLTTYQQRHESRQQDAQQDDSMTRTRTNATVSTGSGTENGVYFGFVNMRRPKSMLKSNAKESFKYCTIVSILFLLWGISYGLLNTLNNVVAMVNNMTTAETLGLTSAYFGGGYFFGPLLVGEWILRRDEHNRSKRHAKNDAENVGGYKVTFILGLCIYGIGTIIFWPSAVTNSYGGFMLSNFVVGFGLSVLEVGANSFMVLCGPVDYGETRLLFAQAVQGIGSVLSGLLAQKVFFGSLQKNTSHESLTLINVQWTYLGITLLCVALGLFFFYMPLPEVSDRELEDSVRRLPINPEKKTIFGLQLRTLSLILAVTAQYLYVATQESNSIFFGKLLTSFLPKGQQQDTTNTSSSESSSANEPVKPNGIALSVSDYLLIAHTAFAVSRGVVGVLTYLSVNRPRLPKPRTLLTICVILCFIFSLMFVVLHPSNPDVIVIPVVLFFFAEGPIWPLIYAMGLRGQGRRTKRAAAFITMGGSGAAFFPFVMYGIMNTGGSVQTSFIVIVALQVAMIIYPGFLDIAKDARMLVDPGNREAPGWQDEESSGEKRPANGGCQELLAAGGTPTSNDAANHNKI